MNLIRATNMFPYILHMADLASKGNVTFKSKLIVLTSNRKNMDVGRLLVEPEALERRFHFNVEMRPKPKYRKRVELGINSPWEWSLDFEHLDS